MALITCNDCKAEISDKASACPKCGAPIERMLGDNEEYCLFCKTVVASDALVCPSCDAVRGYTQARGRIYGRWRTLFWGVLMPTLFALVFFGVGSTAKTGSVGYVLGLVMLIPIVWSIHRLLTGPVWFKRID